MTTLYRFKATFTKSGAATVPANAPTIKVVGVDDAVLVAAATAVTALAELPGTYVYEYSGADNLDPIGRFTTVDTTMDQTTLDSYTSIETREILVDVAAIPTVEEIDSQLSGTHGSGVWGAGGNGGALAITDYPVTDVLSGLPVQGATVELYPTDAYSGIIDQQTTDVFGHVTFSNLTAGTYYLKIIRSGYETAYDSEVAA